MEVEEEKRIEECLNVLVKRRIDECTRLEQEVVNMRSDLEKARIHEEKFKTSSIMLDELIKC